MAKKILRLVAIVGVLVAVVVGVVFAVRPRVVQRGASVADLSVVHPGVRVNGAERRGLARLAPGQRVETDAQGRARVRLDDGTLVLIDRATQLTVDDAKVSLISGRLFVEGVLGARAEISIGDVKVRPGPARVGFDRREGPARVYAANDEIVVTTSVGVVSVDITWKLVAAATTTGTLSVTQQSSTRWVASWQPLDEGTYTVWAAAVDAFGRQVTASQSGSVGYCIG